MFDENKSYGVELLTSNGSVMTEYEHTNEPHNAVEARKNSRYRIKLHNKTNKRALFVVSVDGISVADQKPAGVDSTGYIVQANDTAIIEGWYMDDKTVADFVFTMDEKESMSSISKDGDVKNGGVIGIMVFEEKQSHRNYEDLMDVLTKIKDIHPHTPYPNPWENQPWRSSPWDGKYPKRDIVWYGSKATDSKQNVVTRAISCSPDDVLHYNSDGGISYSSLENLDSDNFNAWTGAGNDRNQNSSFEEFEKDSDPDSVLLLYYGNIKTLKRKGFIVDRYTNKSKKVVDPFPTWNKSKLYIPKDKRITSYY